MHDPREHHLVLMKRILRYLKSTVFSYIILQ
jgi:hypothetical protein